MRTKKYQKKFDYSYALGVYPVVDLLTYHKESVFKVLLREDITENDGVEEIKRLCEEGGVQLVYSNQQIRKIAFKENTYAIGFFSKYESKLENNDNHVVLIEPRNMGNLGTIIRTMLGFGFRDLVLIGDSVDIFDPKVIRSTMGAIFQIKFCKYQSIEEYLKAFGNREFYSFMLDGRRKISEITFKKPFSLIHGNESCGLEKRFKDIGQSVRIPHGKDIDSLNLAIAVGITLWESSKGI